MTSLITFIIATACASEKPSSCKRWTNLRVSKWWTLARVAVALKFRRTLGNILGPFWMVCWHGNLLNCAQEAIGRARPARSEDAV